MKLGPQEFLVSTLEQMADKLSSCEQFADEPADEPNVSSDIVSAAVPVAKAEETQPEPSNTETKSTGAFRILKNFWS